MLWSTLTGAQVDRQRASNQETVALRNHLHVREPGARLLVLGAQHAADDAVI